MDIIYIITNQPNAQGKNKMTTKAKNTHITAHVAGSDFAPKFTWTVANSNNMVEKEFVEYIGRVPNISYY